MTKAELDERLQPICTGKGMGATAYLVLQGSNGLVAKRADLDDELQTELRDMFAAALLSEVLENANLSVLDLSSADERTNVIYRYDLGDPPINLTAIDQILTQDDLPNFSFAHDDLSTVKAIVVLLGDNCRQVAIYKRNYPVSIVKRDSFLSIVKSETRFTRLEGDVLKINDNIDFFKVDGELYILNLATLEKFFGFHDIIVRKAQEGLAAIQSTSLIDNPDMLTNMLSELSFARKLVRVTANSPVLRDTPPSAVIAFTQNHPLLNGKFEYDAEGKQIHLHTKVSAQLFLKLLNDDYLVSELTRQMYDSIAKDTVKQTSSGEPIGIANRAQTTIGRLGAAQ